MARRPRRRARRPVDAPGPRGDPWPASGARARLWGILARWSVGPETPRQSATLSRTAPQGDGNLPSPWRAPTLSPGLARLYMVNYHVHRRPAPSGRGDNVAGLAGPIR